MRLSLLAAGAIVASAIAAPASAAVTFTGYATGCFGTTSTPCTPVSSPPQTGVVVSYPGSSFQYVTSSTNLNGTGNSFSQTTNVLNQAGFAGTDLGSFRIGDANLTIPVGAIFNLLVTFTAPPGTDAAEMTANLSGAVSQQNGVITIDFVNSAENPLLLTYGNGNQFSFYVNDIDIAQSTAGALTAITGKAVLLPEPGTWAMMILGFGAIGMTVRRRQPMKLAQLA